MDERNNEFFKLPKGNAMNKSTFWARLLGLYMVIIYIWMFKYIHHIDLFLSSLANSPLILMTQAIFAIFLGLAIVLSHPVWKGWPIIVTLLGYWIIFKGMVLLYFPEWLHHLIPLWKIQYNYVALVIGFALGLVLLYWGYFQGKK